MWAGWQDKFDFGEWGAEIGMGVAVGGLIGGAGRAYQNFRTQGKKEIYGPVIGQPQEDLLGHLRTLQKDQSGAR